MEGEDNRVCIGVNGFGRIGRLIVRAILNSYNSEVKITAINEPFMTPAHMSFLLTHDTVHGAAKFLVENVGEDFLIVSGQKIEIFKQKDASQIPWGKVNTEFVADASGVNTSTALASAHLTGGASKVILSAPAKDSVTPTIVMGVNEQSYNPSTMTVVSNASCTTNCLAPLAKIVHDNFCIAEGLMTTIHAVTASQNTVDGANKKDWRASRCASQNIIPASTGAAQAVQKVLPELAGRLTGMAFRVPVADVSVVDFTCKLERPITSIQDIADAILHAGPELKHIIGVSTEPLVSSDFIGDARSCIFDVTASIMLNPTFVKLVAFYDNEWAYAVRMVRRIIVLNQMCYVNHNFIFICY